MEEVVSISSDGIETGRSAARAQRVGWRQAFNDWVNQPFTMRGQVAVFMALSAIVPTTLFLGISYYFFAEQGGELMSYRFWSVLVLCWVLGTAVLIARVYIDGVSRQLDPLLEAARELSEGNVGRTVPINSQDELGELAQSFNAIERSLAASRESALGRIDELESEVERLTQANEMQAKFLSSISHEIRTPLSAIVSSARIIQRYHTKKPEVVDRFGDTIAAEGQRLVQVISDLLDISRLETGRIDWRDSEVKPVKLLRRAVQLSQKSARSADIRVDVMASDLLPSIWGDEERLTQVLDNLISNAILASRAGGYVTVSARESAEGVCFSIADCGPGIPHDQLSKIFDKSHSITARDGDGDPKAGTGLGLAICREIVGHYGGRIWAESSPGAGATISFTLPADALRKVAAGEGRADGSSARVLTVMRDGVMAEACVRALRLEDYETRECDSFEAVFEQIAGWLPDVLLVTSSFVWQLDEEIEARLRRAGVRHIVLVSEQEGFVEMSPPTHSEPLLAKLNELAPTGSNVLLVEDDKEYGSVVEFELQQAGYKVIKAFNGRDAVDLVEREMPDAVVLDLALPQLDGFGVLEELKVRELDRPALVLTSLEEPDLEQRLIGLGAVGVFRKYELIAARDSGTVDQLRDLLEPVVGDKVDEVQPAAPA